MYKNLHKWWQISRISSCNSHSAISDFMKAVRKDYYLTKHQCFFPMYSGIISNLERELNGQSKTDCMKKTALPKRTWPKTNNNHINPKSLHHFLSHTNFYFEDFLSFEKFYGCFFSSGGVHWLLVYLFVLFIRL